MHGQILPYLAATVPDILCLQEVVHSPQSDKGWLTYRDGDHVLPQRANFFRDVCRALPDHVATFCPAAQGVLWDDDQPVPSQWGLATFVHKSIPVVAQAQGFVHKSYSPDGFGDHPRSRSAHAVRVFDHTKNRAITVTQMHGLRDLNGKIDTPARATQARKLLKLSQSVTNAGDIAVICGDFNVRPDSQTLTILRDAGMSDLIADFNISTTRNSQYKKPEKFADYMLINTRDAVRDFNVVHSPEVSDHCPLILTL